MTGSMFKRSQGTLFADVADDVVALHVERGHCFGMEKVTASVWKLLDEPKDIDQLCGLLMQDYEVDLDTCRADVTRLLSLLASEGLVTRAD